MMTFATKIWLSANFTYSCLFTLTAVHTFTFPSLQLESLTSPAADTEPIISSVDLWDLSHLTAVWVSADKRKWEEMSCSRTCFTADGILPDWPQISTNSSVTQVNASCHRVLWHRQEVMNAQVVINTESSSAETEPEFISKKDSALWNWKLKEIQRFKKSGNTSFYCWLRLKTKNVTNERFKKCCRTLWLLLLLQKYSDDTSDVFSDALCSSSSADSHEGRWFEHTHVLFQTHFTDSLQICATFYFEKQTEDQQENTQNTQSCVCALMCVCVYFVCVDVCLCVCVYFVCILCVCALMHILCVFLRCRVFYIKRDVLLSLGDNTDYHHLSATTKDCGNTGGDVGRGNTHAHTLLCMWWWEADFKQDQTVNMLFCVFFWRVEATQPLLLLLFYI